MASIVKNLASASLLGLLLFSSAAFINPEFTPLDLVKQSDTIVELEIKNIAKDGMATATVKKVLKGKLDQKELKIDLSGVVPEDGQMVVNRIHERGKTAIMFIGTFPAVGEDNGNGTPEAQGLLHAGGEWIINEHDPDGSWEMTKTDEKLRGTWSGGTDMLISAVKYILKDPQAELPVKEAIDFATPVQAGKIDGKVFEAAPVDVAGKGQPDFFVAAEKGDHLFRWNGKTLEDVTAKSGLTAQSRYFAWGDFNRDGRLDLASWDGKALSIFSQGADGVFSGKALSSVALPGGCFGLTTFDAGDQTGRPALLLSTKGVPVVVTMQADGSAKEKPLVTGELPAKDLGDPAECLVADFDNDGLPDVIQLFSDAGLFYKGVKPGEFAAPVKIAAAVGQGRHGVCIGDWDGSGTLDIFTCSDERNHLWHNLGGGHFIDVINLSGSVAYISKSGGIFAQTSGFNNDGREGLLMLYGIPLTQQLYFNRGFRSFGLSRRLEGEMEKVPQVQNGQQAGCVGDFTGIGARSLALVLASGDVWLFPRKADDSPLGVNVSLSLASPNAGPVTVWAGNERRSFGAAVIRAGGPGFFYGVQDAGPVTVKWQFPGSAVQQKQIIIEDGVKRFVVDKAAGGKK